MSATPPPLLPNDGFFVPVKQLLEFFGWMLSSTLGLSLFAWFKKRYEDRREDRKIQYDHETTWREELREELRVAREDYGKEREQVMSLLKEREDAVREVEKLKQEIFDLRQRMQMMRLRLDEQEGDGGINL